MSIKPGLEAVALQLNLLDGQPAHPLLTAYSHGNMLGTSRWARLGVLLIIPMGHQRASPAISNEEGNCNWHT
jgi:hypothetical protein